MAIPHSRLVDVDRPRARMADSVDSVAGGRPVGRSLAAEMGAGRPVGNLSHHPVRGHSLPRRLGVNGRAGSQRTADPTARSLRKLQEYSRERTSWPRVTAVDRRQRIKTPP
jgi:hypothetical protein